MISKIEMIIYNEILKIPVSMISQYFSPYDRLINLLLVPTVSSVILFYMVTNVVFGEDQKGLKFLVTLTAMIISINSGMYKFMVGLGETWFALFIIAGAILFMLSMVPIRSIGRGISGLRTSSNRAIRLRISHLERRISDLDERIAAKEAQMARIYQSGGNPVSLAREVERLREERLRLERERDTLKIRMT